MAEELEDLLPAEILAALEQGATVVTGNQRAARTLRLGFDRLNRAQGRTNWQPAKVLAWDAWVTGWWSRLVIEGAARLVLLNRSQELALWRAVIEADKELRSLRGVDSLAEMAAEAWQLLCRYNGQGRLRELGVSTDTKAFQRWAFGFEKRCRVDGWLARAGLEEALRSNLPDEMAAGEIVLVGFDALTPAQIALIERLKGDGAVVEQPRPGPPAETRLLVAAEDEGEELWACAAWARDFLTKRRGAKVAVIVPGLEAQRGEMERVFREVLAPELENIAASGEGAPFEFSVGVSLAATPMVMTAVDLLRWVKGALPLERVSGLLLSPYFAGGGEVISARAEFDAYVLRRMSMLRPEISRDALLARMAGKAALAGTISALRRMEGAIARGFAKDDARTHAEWAEAIRDVLKAAEWGRSEGEESIEFQIREKWDSALDELATLDFDGAGVRFEAALRELERITQRTMFAPESHDAPVQVMGPLEAAGNEFDAVWFLRAGELSWPMKSASNSLLPWHLQRELGMPGDAARDMKFAQVVTERIATSGETVLFSYAKESVDGRQRVAGVAQRLGLVDTSIADLVTRDDARVVLDLETIPDVRVAAALPDEVLRGGAKVLELQAACGFRAFAEHRLWSAEIEEIELGMDALESGSVVHSILENFWREVQTQAALKKMTGMERIFVLDEAIERGMEKTARTSKAEWDHAYVEMQRERLRRLLLPWIQWELERPEFTVKALEEQLADVRIGPLRLKLRVDRVDETAGGEVVIDYKTGNAEPRDWLSERPEAPQLPLYAVVAGAENLAAVAFGVVRVGNKMDWKYMAGDTSVLGPQAGKPARMEAANFQEQIELWRNVLTELASQFAAGDARVAPKWFPKTCERCPQRMLCRVDPIVMEEMDDEEEPGFE